MVVGCGGVLVVLCVLCVVVSMGFSVGVWVSMGFQLVYGFQWVPVDPTFLYGVGGVGGGAGVWWFYIVVAIDPITIIIQQYIIIGIVSISISSIF